ncbi:hypothetical protein, partial [Burkholderia ubonensis]|uniref:hypothetical protein n=1 Tax=Burkholderia ubonensis TaxID=101571 RepID=UPI001E5DCD9C
LVHLLDSPCLSLNAQQGIRFSGASSIRCRYVDYIAKAPSVPLYYRPPRVIQNAINNLLPLLIDCSRVALGRREGATLSTTKSA